MTRIKPKHWWSGTGLVVLFAVGLGAVWVAASVASAAEDAVEWLRRPFDDHHAHDDEGSCGNGSPA